MIMTLQEFKEIITKDSGSLSESQIEKLAEFTPDLPIGVKVGYGSRFLTSAKNFKIDLENNSKWHLKEHGVEQYIRDAFIPVSNINQIATLFGWTE
jgi:hypothetical protein